MMLVIIDLLDYGATWEVTRYMRSGSSAQDGSGWPSAHHPLPGMSPGAFQVLTDRVLMRRPRDPAIPVALTMTRADGGT